MTLSGVLRPESTPLISQGVKCTSPIWKCAVISLCFSKLVSADVRWGGLGDEPTERLCGRLCQLCQTTV